MWDGSVLNKIFSWWSGATLGTLFDVGRRASFVGEDETGNRYFEERKASLDGKPRRWVIYKGYADGSKVSPDWHGWMAHTFERPPTVEPFRLKAWEQPHIPNLTGTLAAWRPKGSLVNGGDRPKATGDYEAWKPEP